MVWDDCPDSRFELSGGYIAKLHYQGKCAAAFYYQDLGDDYDATYKKAWEVCKKNATNFCGNIRFIVGTVYDIFTNHECDHETLGNVDISGFATWTTIPVGSSMQFDITYGNDWAIFSPGKRRGRIDSFIFRLENDRSVYFRIKSVNY